MKNFKFIKSNDSLLLFIKFDYDNYVKIFTLNSKNISNRITSIIYVRNTHIGENYDFLIDLLNS